jgi:acyl-CoA thioester hydrolase
VLVDATSERARRIDERERTAWEPYLGEPLTFRRR